MSEETYSRSGGRPVLRKSLVAYLDVLGTSVNAQSERAQELLEALDRALTRARRQSALDEEWDTFHASWFSDNLCIAAPLSRRNGPVDRAYEEGSIGFVINTVMWLQWALAVDGFLLRGAMTVGDQFVDSRVNFGAALVDAAKLEKDVAIHPRVVLSDSAVDSVNLHFFDHYRLADNPFHHELMQDEDGTVFVSYLGAAFEGDDSAEMLEIVSLHRDALRQRRENGPPEDARIREKHEWVEQYHEAFCRTFFPDEPELMIGVSLERSFEAYQP